MYVVGAVGLAGLVLGAGFLSGWWRQTPPIADRLRVIAPPAPAALPRKSIAVLPFENRSSEKENADLADGIHEDVRTSLSNVRDLKVISRGTVLAYKPGESRNLRRIGGELGVGSGLEGSVRRSGNRIRVAAQLIDIADNRSVWAETYDRGLTDVLVIQTQIPQEIAKALEASLSPAEFKQLAVPPTKKPGGERRIHAGERG